MKRINNFDVLRLIFALFVIITHAYPLSGTKYDSEPLMRLTNGQLSFSFLGLKGFFILSGYLVYKSFQRSNTFFDFFKKRVLRIFPALLIMSAFIIFIIGALISEIDWDQYLSNSNVYLYFLQSTTLINFGKIKCLPGVFEKNIHGCEVNGSLWTIAYEFFFYFLFIIYFLVKRNELLIKIGTVLTTITLFYFKIRYIDKYFIYYIYTENNFGY